LPAGVKSFYLIDLMSKYMKSKTAKTTVTVGESGLNNSWQAPFEKEVKCVHCGGDSRIAFVVFETAGEPMQTFVCNIHENDPEGTGYWPHDCIAVAVYLCRKCLEPTAEYNQG